MGDFARLQARKRKLSPRTRFWRRAACNAEPCMFAVGQLFALREVESSEEQAETKEEVMEVWELQRNIRC